MRADMAAQPEVLRRLAERRDEIVASLRGPQPAAIVVVARGSSDYAAIFARYLLEVVSGRPVALAAPSLVTLYEARPSLDGWLAIGISQSGRTPEITTVLERYREAGARTVAVTNDPGSPLAAAAEAAVDLGAGEEAAVPATKTFTAQLAAVALIAEALGPVPWDASDWERLAPVRRGAACGSGAGGARRGLAGRRRRARLRGTRLPDVRGARGRAEAARGHRACAPRAGRRPTSATGR